MISPCQEGKSSPDALRRSACIKFLGASARVRASRRWFLFDREPDIHLLSWPRRASTEDLGCDLLALSQQFDGGLGRLRSVAQSAKEETWQSARWRNFSWISDTLR